MLSVVSEEVVHEMFGFVNVNLLWKIMRNNPLELIDTKPETENRATCEKRHKFLNLGYVFKSDRVKE
jgi:hypothetical protein